MKNTKNPAALKRRKNYCTLICHIILTVATTIVFAETKKHTTTAHNVLTLNTVIQRILSHNPELKGFDFLKKQWQAKRQVATLKPAWSIQFEADDVFGSTPYTGLSQSELSLSLSSIIETAKKRQWRAQEVDQQINLNEIDQQLATLNTLAQATHIYTSLLAAQAHIKLYEEHLKLAEKTLETAQHRVQKGVAFESEVFQAQASLQQTELNLLRLMNQQKVLKLSLSSLWGSTQIDFDKVTGTLMNFSTLPELGWLLLKLENSPHIKRLSAESRLQEVVVQQIKSASDGDLNWQLGINRIQETQDLALTAGISIPLFTKKRNMGQVASIMAKSEQLTLKHKQEWVKFETQLRQAYLKNNASKAETLQLKEHLIPWLLKAHQETRKAYQAGRLSYQELISVQQQVLAAKKQMIMAAEETHRQATIIEQLSAQSLTARENHE